MKCLICKKGEMTQSKSLERWWHCNSCDEDSDEVIDGFAYPTKRRGTMCSVYTPVNNLDVSTFTAGDIIEFSTSRKTIKRAEVLHVDAKNNQMIIEDESPKKLRFVVDNERIDDAYDALFSENKVKFAGWWHKRIDFK